MLRIIGLIICEIPVEILSFVVVPIALLFCKPEDERLPKWATWWDDFKYGINGDPPWQGPEHANGHEREYLWRVRWLLRNRANTFAHVITGFKAAKPEEMKIMHLGDPSTSNRPGHSGWQYIELDQPDGHYVCYYFVHGYGETTQNVLNKIAGLFGVTFKEPRCFRAYLGWKLKGHAESYLRTGIPEGREYVQFVWAVNPVMGFAKES